MSNWEWIKPECQFVCLHFKQLDAVMAGWSEEQKMRFLNQCQKPPGVSLKYWLGLLAFTAFGFVCLFYK